MVHVSSLNSGEFLVEKVRVELSHWGGTRFKRIWFLCSMMFKLTCWKSDLNFNWLQKPERLQST